MQERESLGKSGKGVSPLSVRRDVGVADRINLFVEKLKKIDSDYMPDHKLLAGSASDKKKFKEKHAVWVSKLRDLVKTERRYLAPEGTSEAKKKAKLRATTYRVRMSLYRRHVIQKLDFVNPRFYAQAKSLMNSDLYSDSFQRKIESIVRERSYQKLMKKVRDILHHEADSLNDAEYGAIKELKKLMSHPVLPILSIGERLSVVVKKKSEKSQTARHTTGVRRISINFYLTWMERILTNHKSHDWKNIAIALALATGRRPIELFVTGKFSKPEGNTLLFSGQAKTKLSDSKPYRIPVLYDVDVIQSALKTMRTGVSIPAGATHDDVNKLTAGALRDRMQAVFRKQAVEFYAMRAAYGRLCVQRFYSPKQGTEEHFLASILGHSEDDHATVLHYKTVVFDEEMTIKEAAEEWQKIAKAEAESSPEAFITPELIEQVASHKDKFKRAQARVFEFILTELRKGNGGLTQSYISREGGFNREAIKSVLSEIGEITPPEAKKGGATAQFLRA